MRIGALPLDGSGEGRAAVGPGGALAQPANTRETVPICRNRRQMNIIFLMETMYLTHPSCRLHEMGSWHPESPQRLDAIADQLLVSGLMPFLAEQQAPAAPRDAPLRVHAADYPASL